MTHTYVTLEVSAIVYDEVERKLLAAGYEHALHRDDKDVLIDMHGIALKRERVQRCIEDINGEPCGLPESNPIHHNSQYVLRHPFKVKV